MKKISLDDVRSGDKIKFKYRFRDGREDIVSAIFIGYHETEIQCVKHCESTYRFYCKNSIIEILDWKAVN
jgi:hypothetical protein